jgi:phosphate starvation-inducible protein PhoH and related proteins
VKNFALSERIKIHLFVDQKQRLILPVSASPLIEKTILVPGVDPVQLYGVNDVHLDLFRTFFPGLKIVARGLEMKLTGEEKDVLLFETKLNQLVAHNQRFGGLGEQFIRKMMNPSNDLPELEPEPGGSDIIVYGNNGLVIKARTPNQKRIVQSSYKNDMVFAIGPAGTGKTYTAVALAVRALRNKEVKRIILTRPAVEAGENLGFLPGDLKEKLDPYLQPLYDALMDMIPADKLTTFLETGIIQIAPLAFMRGRTLDNAFVILDEAQNATEGQLKMFLTRMGRSARFVITGDLTQVDLPKNQPSGLANGLKILNNIDGIEIIHLDTGDVIRHKLVTQILHAYQAASDKSEKH